MGLGSSIRDPFSRLIGALPSHIVKRSFSPISSSSSCPQALVLHFPLNGLSPCLLTHPASTTSALNQFKRRQVVGLVLQRHKASRPQQRHHLGGLAMTMFHSSATAERIFMAVIDLLG